MRPLGAGDLQLAFEELKRKLAAEGLFEVSRKKPLPEYPERIGIITSPTGAVLHDMLHVFRRRFPALTLVFRPAKVQGSGAAEDIAGAVADLNAFNEVDLIILARGGGSMEDLWPFNEERVARAIARSRLPLVSAVGHEVDFTIADFVADLRAPTPTAAAELVVPDRRAILEVLQNSRYTMHQALASRISMSRMHIQHLLKSYALHRPIDLLRRHSQHIDELSRGMSTSLTHRCELTTARLKGLDERLQALNPVLVLKRGYAIVRKEGNIVGSRAGLRARDAVEIEFSDGRVSSTIGDV
jgi:exodeoxyribonuclease VII large subunit